MVDAEYYFLVYAPGNPVRWYVAGQPARSVVVPVHLLLHAGFTLLRAVASGTKPSRQQKAALAREAVALPESDEAAAIAELLRRDP